ncbi:phage tail protein [Vibrio fluvialis]|nr:phage tail protein [Vibrio fluvialis]EKO4001900.1 phage tail protein [Vibrio fluvialis]
MSKFFTLLTTVGEAKLANATALGQTVKFEKMAIGDGDGELPVPDQKQTALVNEVRREFLNSVETVPDNPNWIVCEQVIPENVGGWTIREVGIYDIDGDLIAIGNFPETYKPILEEGSGRTQTVRLVLQVSSTATVELKIDPSIVLATRKYSDDQDKAHTDAPDPHPQYAMSANSQFLPYDPTRVYKCGEVCYTETDGKVNYWEWYSNVESLAGKDPLNTANRQTGWIDETKPFYWTPFKKSRSGSTQWPWMSMTFPEGTLNVLGNSVPTAVFWRLAEALPEFVNAGTGMIDFPETGGEFFRVLDQGRGIDSGRAFSSVQLDAFQGHSRILRRSGGGSDTVHGQVGVAQGSSYNVPMAQGNGDAWKPGEYNDDGHGTPRVGYETRPRNLAFPILVEV